MQGLSVINVSKSFGRVTALANISVEVQGGQTTCLLGPSGCGKSTLLNLIAGLDHPDAGELFWEGHSLSGIPPHRRNFGLMFQDYALFPHLNVFDNIAFGLRMAHLPDNQVRERVSALLDQVGLSGFESRDVNTLSGGEQQRVALARSLAPGPRLLMLDEPLGALDRSLREGLVQELRYLLRQDELTVIYVTHDQQEAFALADQVIVMNAGRVEQSGTPQQIYRQPASVFVARFLGLTNLLPCEVRLEENGWVAKSRIGDIALENGSSGNAVALLRSDAAVIGTERTGVFQGVVTGASFRGDVWRLEVVVQDTRLTFEFASYAEIPQPGSRIFFGLDAQKITLLTG
jgi:ABC-type Fe3+/spermidine/putrescine transport system ATPase subunit